jgi:polyisoprenoid-binding protein YceI
LKFVGDTPKTVEGYLTLLGITRPVKLTITLFGCVPHPLFKKELCGADAEGELYWSDFGIRKYGDGDTDKVHLRIQVEALKQDRS